MVRSFRWWKFFPCRKIGNVGIQKNSEFNSPNWNFCEFWEPPNAFVCLESSNSNHWRDWFLLTTSYFLAHCFWTCIITILAPTLKMTETHIPSWTSSLRLEIVKTTDWAWLIIGTSTLNGFFNNFSNYFIKQREMTKLDTNLLCLLSIAYEF